jgi:transcriptional regulator with XRE-family HTH domain
MLSRIIELCERAGITPTELSRQLGFSESAISRWEVHAPSIERVKMVADYFDVSVDYLTDRTDIRRMAEKTLSDPDLAAVQKLRETLSQADKRKMMRMLEVQFQYDGDE